jgi:hypothetical protein
MPDYMDDYDIFEEAEILTRQINEYNETIKSSITPIYTSTVNEDGSITESVEYTYEGKIWNAIKGGIRKIYEFIRRMILKVSMFFKRITKHWVFTSEWLDTLKNDADLRSDIAEEIYNSYRGKSIGDDALYVRLLLIYTTNDRRNMMLDLPKMNKETILKKITAFSNNTTIGGYLGNIVSYCYFNTPVDLSPESLAVLCVNSNTNRKLWDRAYNCDADVAYSISNNDRLLKTGDILDAATDATKALLKEYINRKSKITQIFMVTNKKTNRRIFYIGAEDYVKEYSQQGTNTPMDDTPGMKRFTDIDDTTSKHVSDYLADPDEFISISVEKYRAAKTDMIGMCNSGSALWASNDIYTIDITG